MKKYLIEFTETINNHHQIIVSVPDHVDYDEMDNILDELERDCHSFDDVKPSLRWEDFTIVDDIEDESCGEIEFDYLSETELESLDD